MTLATFVDRTIRRKPCIGQVSAIDQTSRGLRVKQFPPAPLVSSPFAAPTFAPLMSSLNSDVWSGAAKAHVGENGARSATGHIVSGVFSITTMDFKPSVSVLFGHYSLPW